MVRVSAATRILICGQAPGRRVHESGLPFDDPSGDRLRAWMGVDRATFYGHPAIGVAAQAFCFPGTDPAGGDYPPPPRCAALWRTRLLAALPNVELTLLVGRPAQLWALGKRAGGSMTETVRAWRAFAARRAGAAASLLAQHRLAEEEPLVRGRGRRHICANASPQFSRR